MQADVGGTGMTEGAKPIQPFFPQILKQGPLELDSLTCSLASLPPPQWGLTPGTTPLAFLPPPHM